MSATEARARHLRVVDDGPSVEIRMPSCRDAERGIIAAVIEAETQRQQGEQAQDLIASAGGAALTPDFESSALAAIWRLLCERHGASLPNDVLSFIDACRLDKVSLGDAKLLGSDLMAWLDAYVQARDASLPSLALCYVREIRETAERRRKISQTAELLRRLQDDMAPLPRWLPDVAAAVGETVLAIGDNCQTMREHVLDAMPRIESLVDRGSVVCDGVPTGIQELDNLLGGLRPGRLVVIGGRTSTGKSALALTVALNAALQEGVRSLYVSCEMSARELTERMIAQVADYPGARLWRGPVFRDDLRGLTQAAARVSELPVRIVDWERDWPTIVGIAQREVALGAKLVVLDYLGLMHIRGEKLDHWQMTGRITAEAKQLANRMQVPVILVAQLNREAVKTSETRPQLSHFRGSGDIEQDADVAILIHRDIESNSDRAELLVRKNRGGQTAKVDALWDGPTMRFRGMPEGGEDERYGQ